MNLDAPKIAIAAVFSILAAGALAAAEAIPRFQRNTGYEAASRTLKAQGWRPAPLPCCRSCAPCWAGTALP